MVGTRITVEELQRLIADDRPGTLPFVGSGLALGAGALSAGRLAINLAERTGVSYNPTGPSLTAVTRLAEDAHGVPAVQRHLAEIITGLRLRPTPSLTAVCGTRTRRVLTTNYDDGIERAARDRGLEPVPLLPNDARIVDDPPEGHLHVIHLHGVPGRPESLVLPGATTSALDDDSAFAAFVGAVMALRQVLYLGFSLGIGERHLHRIIPWLHRNVTHAGRDYLLLPASDIADRPLQVEQIETYRIVTLVPYEKDPAYTAVERIALELAPRSGPEVTWVQPPLLRVAPEDDEERLRQRMAAVDFGCGDGGDISQPVDLLTESRALITGSAGMGKTTLLRYLPHLAEREVVAIGDLRDFRPARSSARPASAIHRLLRLIPDGGPLPVERLDGANALLMLDGLDEVDQKLRTAALHDH